MNDLELYVGEDKRFSLNFNDENGDAIDITGWKIYFTIKADLGDEDPGLLQVITTSLSDPVNGIAQVHVPTEKTSLLVPGQKHYYDYRVIKANGDVSTILKGNIKIFEPVTEATT